MPIKVSTGRVSDNVEVIDTIFAMDSHKEGFWTGAADPNKAFEGVKNNLYQNVKSLGACNSGLSI